MAKGQLMTDTFEKLAELGSSTVKKTGKVVVQTFTPAEFIRPSTENATPLDIDKLKERYQRQDVQKEEELKRHLFQLVKEGEKQVVSEAKKKEEERERMLLQEDRDRKRKEQEKMKQDQADTIPRGKQRRSIFSPKKAAQRQHAETKPSVGKQ